MEANLTAREILMLKALAQRDLNVSQAAEYYGCSRQAAYYKLNRIEAKTGINPNTFYGLNELLKMIEKEEN